MVTKEEKRQAKQEAKEARRAQKAERRQQRRQAKAVLSRSKIAEQFRVLASQIEGGTFVLGDKEMELPPYADFKITYRVKPRGRQQIQIQVRWGGPGDVPLPTE